MSSARAKDTPGSSSTGIVTLILAPYLRSSNGPDGAIGRGALIDVSTLFSEFSRLTLATRRLVKTVSAI